MIVFRTITELQNHLKDKANIAFVPTMGCLHDGHLSLIKKAQEVGNIVVVSIFVNKAQFNDAKDYDNYPRQEKEDLDKLENCKSDIVFIPNEEEMSKVILPFSIPQITLDNSLCGKSRPGHFDGVAMIVSKFFHIIKPDFAIFGQKDFQQLAIIRDLVKKLKLEIEILSKETYREKSGLAFSSRNERLSVTGRNTAAEIFKVLNEIKSEVRDSKLEISEILQRKSDYLLNNGFDKIDYLEIRTEENLELVNKFDIDKPARIFIAIHLESVRLIDNLELN